MRARDVVGAKAIAPRRRKGPPFARRARPVRVTRSPPRPDREQAGKARVAGRSSLRRTDNRRPLHPTRKKRARCQLPALRQTPSPPAFGFGQPSRGLTSRRAETPKFNMARALPPIFSPIWRVDKNEYRRRRNKLARPRSANSLFHHHIPIRVFAICAANAIAAREPYCAAGFSPRALENPNRVGPQCKK